MILKNQNAGQIFVIKDVPEKVDCENCNVCMRLRLMELGLMPGSLIELSKRQAGLWVVNLLSNVGIVESTIALRDEEAERIILEDEACSINFEPYY
jgi:Fe2+ transport system protein FeoA